MNYDSIGFISETAFTCIMQLAFPPFLLSMLGGVLTTQKISKDEKRQNGGRKGWKHIQKTKACSSRIRPVLLCHSHRQSPLGFLSKVAAICWYARVLHGFYY